VILAAVLLVISAPHRKAALEASTPATPEAAKA
jgi:hypothetical protein